MNGMDGADVDGAVMACVETDGAGMNGPHPGIRGRAAARGARLHRRHASGASSARRRRAILFSFDALLGSLLLLAALIVILSHSRVQTPAMRSTNYAQDAMLALSAIPVGAVEDPWVRSLVANGTISDPTLPVLEQIGAFWATNQTGYAENLSRIMLGGIFPPGFSIALVLEDDRLYDETAAGEADRTSVSRRMITGIAKGEALQGSTSAAYLKKIQNKRTAAFLTFGGFVGQGDITARFPLIPLDAEIVDLLLEIDAASPFTLAINGIPCGGLYSPSGTNFTPDVWDISACNASFTPGSESDVTIAFPGDLNESYIAGGFLRARYTTDSFSEFEGSRVRHYLPGIEGIINLYDAFFVPGSLRNMTLYLHYQSDFTTYVTIGDSQVYWSNDTGERFVNLTDSNLTSFPALLDYDFLSNQTVPFRMASYDDTVQEVIGSNADIVLITDLSGSMEWRLDTDNVKGNQRACSNPDVYHLDDTERLTLAKCLDIEFTDVTLNESLPNNLNRQWLVDYNLWARYYSNDLLQLTHDLEVDEIKDYKKPTGGTCIPCALNLAYSILDTWSNENRSKFVVLMTDGIPTHCTDNFFSCDVDGTGIFGLYSPGGCTGDTTDCSSGDCDGPIQAAINAAQRLHDDMNVSVYTIGIGPITIAGCDSAEYLLETMANDTNGTYNPSRNASHLRSIYRDIAQDILLRSSQTSQFVTIRGNLSPSNLYPDSYLDVVYDPVIDDPGQNEITVTQQTGQFGSCAPSFELPANGRFISASITSYSDEHWTDLVTVNGETVFNLSAYDTNYVRLGDPYQVQVPVTALVGGTNTLVINTADQPGNSSGCSDNNTMIYTLAINTSTARSTVLEKAVGCNWTIEFDDGQFLNVEIPASYAGAKSCSYTNASISYDPLDAYDYGVYRLLEQLDFDDDGRVFVNIEAADLEIIVTVVTNVPYLWGPSMARLEVRQ